MRRGFLSRPIVFFVACAALGSGLVMAPPAGAQPMEVASGEDLTAWQMLEHRRLDGEAAVASYRRFVLDFATSPLATAAWGRLVSMHADVNWAEDATTRSVIDDVRGAWLRLEASRVMAARSSAVAAIDLTESDNDAAVMDEDSATGL